MATSSKQRKRFFKCLSGKLNGSAKHDEKVIARCGRENKMNAHLRGGAIVVAPNRRRKKKR
jgi:hypothetical protein